MMWLGWWLVSGVALAGWSGGYYGELLTHPGVYGSLDQAMLNGERDSLRVGGAVGSYLHLKNHIGVSIRPEVGWVREGSRGGGVEAFAGIGVLHAFAPARTVNSTNAGRPALPPALRFGGGAAVSDGMRLHFGAAALPQGTSIERWSELTALADRLAEQLFREHRLMKEE